VVDPGITEIKCEICKIVYCIQCQVSFLWNSQNFDRL
jgi:hypothetical protein